MTFEERADKASEAIYWSIPHEMVKDALRAAFPELCGEWPITHCIMRIEPMTFEEFELRFPQ